MTTPLAETSVETPLEHEHAHDLRLVLVDYDDAGKAVSEYECASCGIVWFD